jgi:hypothetical protein
MGYRPACAPFFQLPFPSLMLNFCCRLILNSRRLPNRESIYVYTHSHSTYSAILKHHALRYTLDTRRVQYVRWAWTHTCQS